MLNLFKYISRFINWRMGSIGALVMFTAVFIINFDFGWLPALTAGLKQAAYTLFIGGLIIRLCEFLATSIQPQLASAITACLVPSAVATTIVYFVHSLKGTPLPFESTIPTIVFSVPGFLFIGIRKRKEQESGMNS